jgi:hypothetical protein
VKLLVAIFALIALTLSPVAAAAQGMAEGCSDSAVMAPMDATSAMTPSAPQNMPCCPHGKGCAAVCACSISAIAPAPVPTGAARTDHHPARLETIADRMPLSALQSTESPPPRPIG